MGVDFFAKFIIGRILTEDEMAKREDIFDDEDEDTFLTIGISKQN